MLAELLRREIRAATVDAAGLSAYPRKRARLLDTGADHAVLAVVGAGTAPLAVVETYLHTGVVAPLAVERQLVAMCDLVGEDLRRHTMRGRIAAVEERISQIASGT